MKGEEKICQSCGRKFGWRKKWEDCWEEVKYCSVRCKSNSRNNKKRELLRGKILNLCKERGRNKSLCPSEVLTGSEKLDKNTMEEVRCIARLLCYEGKIEILQKGIKVDPTQFKGPIRLRIAKPVLD